jgi:hypothetical protein
MSPSFALDSTIREPTREESDVSDSLEQARDRRAGLRSTIDQVERALARPAHGPADEWSRDLGEQLSSMSAALDQHIAVTEDKDGLLADILEAAPRLAHLIDHARSDHRRLRAELDEVLLSLPVDSDGVSTVRADVTGLLGGLVRHRQTGADLVYEAYQVDIDAAD